MQSKEEPKTKLKHGVLVPVVKAKAAEGPDPKAAKKKHHDDARKVHGANVTIIKPIPAAQLKALIKGKLWTFQDFEILATVGMGTFSRVRVVKVKNSPDRTAFALKILVKAEVIRLKQVVHTLGEKLIMNMVEHPFIVNLLTTFQDEKRLFMLLEYVNGGELFAYLRMEGRLPNDHAKFFAGEIILAFAYLHTLHVVYRDLKPENCLIDAEGHIKIADFGFSKIVDDRTWTLCGTPEYLAPEVIQSFGHGKGVDWWALGILTFEMLAGYPPFYDETPFGTYQKILACKLDFPRHFDVKARDLIKKLLQTDVTKRAGCLKHGAEDLKKHKWYKGMDWDQLLNRSLTKDVPFVPLLTGLDDTAMFDKYPESIEGSAPIVAPKDQELFENFSTELN